MRPRLALSLVAALCLASASRSATAQVKPKIMIIFDTSGSMLSSSDQDGSPLCNNQGRSSRIYQLKVALFDALQGVGATEVDFALATFPMFVDPQRTPACPNVCNFSPSPNQCAGHYYVRNSQDSESDSSRSACKVSTHNPSTQRQANCGTNTCGWYAGYKAEVLKVPFGRPPEQILYYFDQQEDTGSGPVLRNPEVRARGNWYTPLGKSLFYAHGYFHREVALPANDYRKKCERLVVAFFTDGVETCNESSSNAFYPTTWARNLRNNLGVVVNTVAIDTNQGLIQSIANAGGGSYFNVAGNANALKQAFLQIIANSLPPAETCNGKDDDCDNKVDEDFPQKGKACDNGKLGACRRTGTYVCTSDGSGLRCNAANANGKPEVCNGIDDDCDGQIDEGLTNCAPCVPQPEVCDGRDNNCNGKIDDGVPSGACGTNIGECKSGTLKCVNGKSICAGGVGPKTEVCNGKDDDCDGQVDGFLRGCYPFTDSGCDPKTGVCKGQCRLGQETCTTGTWGPCSGAVGPAKEVCDGVDNNCDGQVDEKAECPGGSQCIEGECSRPCTGGEFLCKKGQICKNGWCVLDKCDRAVCAAKGWICRSGECVDPCQGVACKSHEKCEGGVCVDQTCYNPAKRCPAGQTCVKGVCATDPCANVSCGLGQYCDNGTCVSLCDTLQCEPGQTCKVVDQGGKPQTQCVDDACASVACGGSNICKDGKCIQDPCLAVGCPPGQRCVDGRCSADGCDGVSCPAGYECKIGSCVVRGDLTTKRVLATGAGGVACNVPGSGALGSPPWALLALLVLGVVVTSRRRRRRRRR